MDHVLRAVGGLAASLLGGLFALVTVQAAFEGYAPGMLAAFPAIGLFALARRWLFRAAPSGATPAWAMPTRVRDAVSISECSHAQSESDIDDLHWQMGPPGTIGRWRSSSFESGLPSDSWDHGSGSAFIGDSHHPSLSDGSDDPGRGLSVVGSIDTDGHLFGGNRYDDD